MLTSILYIQFPASFPPLLAALQPSNAAPDAATMASPPAYALMNAQTVTDVWREFKEGIAGGPAVEKLELQWQARWRPEAKQRTAWCRRKVIVDEVLHLIHSGLAPAAAVAELEAQRGSQTLPKLHDALLALQRQR
jgi:hypothetical protein